MMPPDYNSADLGDALESAVLAMLRVPPIRQALNDILQIYGISGQFREVISNQHDQIVAIAGILTLIYTRLIEHDKRAVEVSKNTLTILHRQAERMRRQDELPDEIAALAAAAIEQLHAEAMAEIALIDAEAAEARALLLRARADATQAASDAE